MRTLFLSAALFFAQISGAVADDNPFIAGGVPASDREWNGGDYVATFQTIQTRKVPLPLLEDKFGKQIIDRLTNTKNFALNKNKGLPLNQRLGDYLQIQQGLNSILKVYVTQANQGKDLHRESAAILAFSLRVAALGVELVNEFIPTIPKDDKYEVRMQGLKQMYAGLTTSFAGAVTSLSETKFYSDDDLTIILTAMHATLPILKQGFTPDYKGELQVRLARYKKQFEGDDLKFVEGMIKTLKTEQDAAMKNQRKNE